MQVVLGQYTGNAFIILYKQSYIHELKIRKYT